MQKTHETVMAGAAALYAEGSSETPGLEKNALKFCNLYI